MSSYDKDFYDFIRPGSLRSARIIIPMVYNLLGTLNSIADVGCGEGVWLSVWKDIGKPTDPYDEEICVHGFDGGYVGDENLLIDPSEFTAVDLEKELVWPQRFSLVESLEVAEHLSEARADTFIDNLTAISDIVLFSAAIPGQGGRDHINEQWPDYWDTKFQARGYRGTNYIRESIWDNPEIENWYRQNIILYMKYVPEPLEYMFQDSIDDRIHPNNTHIVGR